MSSARARILPIIGRLFRAVVWTLLLAVLAAAGAGLVAAAWHAPGSAARAELTYAGDASLGPRLDAAMVRLELIAADVAILSQEAKTALGEITSSDPARLRAALESGGLASTRIDTATKELRASLVGLPGDGPNSAIEYSNGILFRRAAILAALDAAGTLVFQWQHVSGRAVDATDLIHLIDGHDRIVLEAASKGRVNEFLAASTILDDALATVAEVKAVRVRLIAGTENTVLDEWIDRTGAYDLALKRLYVALNRSGGEVTILVQAARLEEQAAFAQLPQDRRTIVVIVAEVARGGLTQAVVAIEDARGRIDEALDSAT